MISGSLPPIRCGVGDYTAQLSQQMAKAGVDFELLSTAGVSQDTAGPLMTVPNWKITSLPKMLAAISRSRADIIHIEYPAVGYRRQLGINLLPYAVRLIKPKLKLVITLHEYSQSRWIGRLRNRLTIIPVHIILVSNQVDSQALNKLGRKISLVPISANFETTPRKPDRFKQILTESHLNPAIKTLVFFGYAFPVKRLEILLDAMNEPPLRDSQLLIFPEINGISTYQRMLKSKISKLRDRVGVHSFL
ncbi:MAG TPA: glycosyltransferase, partial [Candidatus Saccharimonadales bacterium]|nr:glycosyltransferase [Candidatus Saccharimonadales bacterium]